MKKLHALALFAALAFIHATPAFAADITEESVKKFYEDNTLSFKLSYEEYYKTTYNMTAPEFVGTTKLTLVMPGQEPVEQEIQKTKTDLMNEAADGYESMNKAQLAYDVKVIMIAPDKQSADVSTFLTIKDMSVKGVPAKMRLSSTGNCNDRLIATPEGLKIVSSVCSVRAVVGQKS